jgi:hypothetical protein
MDDVEQFSRTLSAIAQSGAYSAKDIRQICAQEVQCCEEPILWADNIPYAAIRTPAVRVTVYERSSDIQEKDCRPNSKLDSWPYRVVAFLNEVIDIFVLAITEDFL